MQKNYNHSIILKKTNKFFEIVADCMDKHLLIHFAVAIIG